jgi:DNA helicase-2/ATP-dependent DNA helicase PcrA
VHKAVQEHFRARLDGRPLSEDDIVAAFRAAWVSEGFLSRQHEEQRLRAGEDMLRRFYREEQARPLRPTAVEQDFSFVVIEQGGAASRPPDRLALGEVNSARALSVVRTKVVGRYDLVVEEDGQVTILDFKTGAVDDARKAGERARESLQLDLYALAWLRGHGTLPDRLELRFLESGLAGSKRPTLEQARATEETIRAVAGRIRRQEFPATPSYMACGQCAFRDICPHTARGPEETA